MAFARSFIALVALLCFAIVAVVHAQAASGDVTKLQIGVKVSERARDRGAHGFVRATMVVRNGMAPFFSLSLCTHVSALFQ